MSIEGLHRAANDKHIFISYQWDTKQTVLEVRNRLKKAGYRVWIDEDDMCEQSRVYYIVIHQSIIDYNTESTA